MTRNFYFHILQMCRIRDTTAKHFWQGALQDWKTWEESLDQPPEEPPKVATGTEELDPYTRILEQIRSASKIRDSLSYTSVIESLCKRLGIPPKVFHG